MSAIYYPVIDVLEAELYNVQISIVTPCLAVAFVFAVSMGWSLLRSSAFSSAKLSGDDDLETESEADCNLLKIDHFMTNGVHSLPPPAVPQTERNVASTSLQLACATMSNGTELAMVRSLPRNSWNHSSGREPNIVRLQDAIVKELI